MDKIVHSFNEAFKEEQVREMVKIEDRSALKLELYACRLPTRTGCWPTIGEMLALQL